MSEQLTTLENSLKEAYNNYIDAMVAYLDGVKAEPNNTHPITTFRENNAPLYLLDHVDGTYKLYSNILVRNADTESLLKKKVN
ncbi:hypothetical protein AB2T85_05575 [Clostridium butyricum]|uniref:hypothetical protein n=1 Tax=Clostridium butyricum TaxID=1492 RepID=UPI00346700C0